MTLSEIVLHSVVVLLIMDFLVWLYALKSLLASLQVVIDNRTRWENCRSRSSVCVVIPARNECENIRKCIVSIEEQSLNPVRIVVVDDQSDDCTAKVVEELKSRYHNLHYIRIDRVPEGWLGKNYACFSGFEVCRDSDIVVFIDADTHFVDPKALEVLVCGAEQGVISSFVPRFECSSSLCKLFEIAFTTLSHAFLGFDKVSNPTKRLAWFFGCCWAIRTNIYQLLGGHSAVRGSVVEDKAIAVKAKALNIPITVTWGVDKVSTKWYNTIRENYSAVKRILLEYSLNRGKAILGSALIALGYYLPLVGLITSILIQQQILKLILVSVSLLTLTALEVPHIITANRFDYPMHLALISFIFIIVVSAALVSGMKTKTVEWKGRGIDMVRSQVSQPSSVLSTEPVHIIDQVS